jgi:DNA-binding LacI/PurR family transcriptional regulator
VTGEHQLVTMKDVAAAAGVAQSTVSRILNDSPGRIPVSDKTRERVRAIARELQYRPNPNARALRGAPTMLLGAVVRDLADPFFGPAIGALAIAAKERGYSVMLCDARAKTNEALALTAVLEERQCDAIVLVGDMRDEPRLIEDLRRAHVRVVALWYGSQRPGRPFPTVGVDNRAGVRSAMDHFTSGGHRRIAFVGAASFGDMEERRTAYEEYLASTGLVPVKGYVRLVPNTIRGSEFALSPLLRLSPRPTAILAASDTLAIGLIHAASVRGVAVPDQLSIIGFDDIPFAAATVPGLTSVKMPIAKIVAAAVEIAIGEVDWRSSDIEDPPRVVFQPKLIVRNSTKAIAPEAYGE